MPWIAWLMLACILDRTGQSATQRMQRELMDHRTRIQNIERQFIQVEARVNQLEELTHSRGKKELMQLENLDELQSEVVRLRGRSR